MTGDTLALELLWLFTETRQELIDTKAELAMVRNEMANIQSAAYVNKFLEDY